VLRLAPPLIVTGVDIAAAIEILRTAFAAVESPSGAST
jgi:4-aminobutyrate aminotransferase-like enzyme